ncbi:FAD-binding oxidoreductase, partial [Kineococcus glutinatus]|uniref:FAD-binding oxidoreductase n=1 Tax=Kineococcus glutinatus TaxID=1070872 RepID=UPI003CD05796
ACGLAALAGFAPGVGVVGYTLGGGLGWLARSHGLAAASVTAADVVTADGVLRRVGPGSDPDLLWALRGGGGSFGIVTALEFRLYPITTVHAGALAWPAAEARRVLRAWRAWTAALPASVTSVARVLHLPPLPELPPALRGRSLVVVEAAMQEDAAEADRLLAGLRALAPEQDSFADVPVADLGALHLDPVDPTPTAGHGVLLADLPVEAVDAFADALTGPGGTALASAELRHLGGALAPERAEGGAVAALDAPYALF